MIERLPQSHGIAFGLAITGEFTAADITTIAPLIEDHIQINKHPIGLLIDISQMHGATWAARWDEMRFLQHHSDRIARLALICNDQWQELSEMTLVATSFLQAETIYCYPTEIAHAWHWVRMNKITPAAPLKPLYAGRGLFQDYTPEYVGI